ncbi:MAG TPA: UDP-glucose 4-epimerase GalE, partial [Mycobacteriales bacterium]
MDVLITGGAGYIGSTIATALEGAGHTPVLLDSLYKGRREFTAGRAFYEGDVADRDLLARIVDEHPAIGVTVHCAARISVPESVAEPYAYYRENVAKSLELFDALIDLGRPRVVFSSSGSVYATGEKLALEETDPTAPTSPYARTKIMMETVLTDMCAATDLRALLLRYFNPIGADPSFRSGPYDPNAGHVLGQLVAAARGEIPAFGITGTDYPTRDGTGIRDYVHVWDVALAHVAAVERFDAALEGARSTVVNVGNGDGVSVREMVAAFERVFGAAVPIEERRRRPGDAIGGYAVVDKAARVLGWRAASTLDEGIASALAWAERRGAVLPDLG